MKASVKLVKSEETIEINLIWCVALTEMVEILCCSLHYNIEIFYIHDFAISSALISSTNIKLKLCLDSSLLSHRCPALFQHSASFILQTGAMVRDNYFTSAVLCSELKTLIGNFYLFQYILIWTSTFSIICIIFHFLKHLIIKN